LVKEIATAWKLFYFVFYLVGSPQPVIFEYIPWTWRNSLLHKMVAPHSRLHSISIW
jgi:hypothetical protein